MIGKLLRGHYRIVRFLGGGGGGETYIAVDTDRPGQPQCVVKRLKPASDEPNFLPLAKKLFKREAETLEQLGKHDQIPRLLAYFEEEGEFYLVQDLIEGQPLSVELPFGRRWSETKIIQLLDDVLRILEFVHSQGAIHRDIKPANLIRRHEDGKIVLIDFGAVKQISQDPQNQAHVNPTTISIGTQGYMSSEQVRGRPRPSSDIYSLGMIGIQALTGIDPIRLMTDRDGEVIWQHYVSVSDELAMVLTKMVREHFRDRYESVAEVLQALKPLIDQRLGEESDDSATQPNRFEADERAFYANSSFGSQETKILANYDDQSSCTTVNATDSALELRETKVVPHLELASDPYILPISESRATKFAAASEANLQEGRETVGRRHQLANFRDFSTRNRSLMLAAGGLAVVALTALIWILPNSGKQPAPVVQSLPSPISESSPSQTPESSVIASASQAIYAELEQYLQQKNWKAADKETYEVMLKMAGPKSTETGELDMNEWGNLECRDFQEIDSLWREASDGRLGFTAQLELFRTTFKQVTGEKWEPESQGNADEEDKTAIRESSSVYFDKIGWRPLGEPWRVQWEKPSGTNRYQYVPGKEPDFEDPTVGHLPAILPWSDGQDYRLQKASACKL